MIPCKYSAPHPSLNSHDHALSSEAADTQIKGCPGQQYRRKTGKREAIDYYRAKWEANEVAKWVEMRDD
jgi:hypothetical protein